MLQAYISWTDYRMQYTLGTYRLWSMLVKLSTWRPAD